MECSFPSMTGGHWLAVTDGNGSTFPLLDFLHFPLLLPYKDNLACIFVFLFCVLFSSLQRRELTYLPTFSLFYFQFCIDTHVVRPHGPVFSERTYVILIGGVRGKGLMKLSMSCFFLLCKIQLLLLLGASSL